MNTDEIMAILNRAPKEVLDAKMIVTHRVGDMSVTYEGAVRTLVGLGLVERVEPTTPTVRFGGSTLSFDLTQ